MVEHDREVLADHEFNAVFNPEIFCTSVCASYLLLFTTLKDNGTALLPTFNTRNFLRRRNIPEDVGKGSAFPHYNAFRVEFLPPGSNHPVQPATCEVTMGDKK